MTTTPRRADEPTPIDLRIVVDGASTAGKTTTARSLGERLGRPVVTPEEHDGRTLLFDWMDHEGGRSDGRPIRTQLVAVPGHLPHLRARLLVTADVVLFVADTSAAGIRASEVALAQVRTLLDALGGIRPGLVIQANKRDAPDALPIDEVTRRLTAEGDDLIIETVALTGEGVRQSYVYAVRLGLQHARAVDGPRVAERQMTSEALLRELDTDPRPIAEVERAAEIDGEPDSEPVPEPGGELDAETEPADDHPAETQPAETQPAETQPAETQPADDQPAETEPADDEPVEDVRALEPVLAGASAPALPAVPDPPSAPAVLAVERPQHDHPRAWRRWFDA